MALNDTIDPFGTPDLAINPNPDSSTFSKLSEQWNGFLSDPSNRAAVMSFGLQLMQPIGLGQTAVGQVGAAIGQAGEGLRTKEKLDLAETEAERKARDTEDRANQRLTTATQKETALGISAGRLQFAKDAQQRREQIQQERLDLQTRRADAKTEFERQQIDNRIRRLDQMDRQIELNSSDVRRTGEVTDRQQESELAAAARAAAAGISKQLQPNPYGLNIPIPDHLKPYQGMTPDQVYNKVYGDMQTAPVQPRRVPTTTEPSPAPQTQPSAPPGARGAIPEAAVQALLADPSRAAEFDAKFGKGVAARIIAGGQ